MHDILLDAFRCEFSNLQHGHAIGGQASQSREIDYAPLSLFYRFLTGSDDILHFSAGIEGGASTGAGKLCTAGVGQELYLGVIYDCLGLGDFQQFRHLSQLQLDELSTAVAEADLGGLELHFALFRYFVLRY